LTHNYHHTWLPGLANIWVFIACRFLYIDLLTATDKEIFEFAKAKNAIIMTKDDDFIKLQREFNSPPKIIWITCGNTTNQRMRDILKDKLNEALMLLENNDLVEIL
jgi:predicted nuclease of predicted toxin-antitoxin system